MKCEIKGYEDIEFEAGQKWKTRGGEIVEITKVYNNVGIYYPLDTKCTSYARNGRLVRDRKSKEDLVELVGNVEESVEPGDVEEPDEAIITELAEPVGTETEQVDDNLYDHTGLCSLKLENTTEFTLPEISVEDKMVDILIQLLRQRDRDLEKLSLVFNTFIKMEKMK